VGENVRRSCGNFVIERPLGSGPPFQRSAILKAVIHGLISYCGPSSNFVIQATLKILMMMMMMLQGIVLDIAGAVLALGETEWFWHGLRV